jgi:hypothetical protein
MAAVYQKVSDLFVRCKVMGHLKNGKLSVEDLRAAQQFAISMLYTGNALAISRVIIDHEGPSVIDREAAIMLSYIKHYEATGNRVGLLVCNFVIYTMLECWNITDQSIIAEFKALAAKMPI